MRIIGGQWRGSKVVVADVDGLRPTPDRVRETLFNWLNFRCHNARVLDCCAGSGVLGLEAASRGAQSVVMVEPHPAAQRALVQANQRLDAQTTALHRGDIVQYLDSCRATFDLVFIDPPYALPELREQILQRLIERQLLAPGAWVYLEWPKQQGFDLKHAGLTWVKQKTAGAIGFAIAQWQ